MRGMARRYSFANSLLFAVAQGTKRKLKIRNPKSARCYPRIQQLFGGNDLGSSLLLSVEDVQ
jgi:hypothetical protein